MRWARAMVLSAVVIMAATSPAKTEAQVEGATPQLPEQIRQRLHRASAGLRSVGPSLSQKSALLNKQAPDSLHVFVVGVDFSDSLMVGRSNADPEFSGWPKQRRTAQRIFGSNVPLFAAHDAGYFDVQMRKLRDYYRTVSFDRFRLGWEVHPEIINVARYAKDPRTRMGYYGDEDSSTVRLAGLAQAVMDSIDADVDFSGYDTLILIHAGAGEETDVLGDSPEQIFSNYLDVRDFESAVEAGTLSDPWVRTDEMNFEHVLVLPEAESQDPVPEANFSGIFDTLGVYAFEFGLRLGMLNMGDFTPSNYPDSQGIGNFGLMGYGLFNGIGFIPAAPCAFNRWLMGWVERIDVTTDATIRIGAMGREGDAASDSLLVRVPISDREYWLVEYRLQDPDGSLSYSFGDSNYNGIPDFRDADSTLPFQRPETSYDPTTDEWESLYGSEWDYQMSNSPARPSGVRCAAGGGSGLYIWHVDERVISDVVSSGVGTINSDADHSGVDVEEADGVQDLDDPRINPYYLGWDGDAWRGEGAAEFGPATYPSTESADGRPTGIRIFDVGEVVADSLYFEGECAAFNYRPAIQFSVEFNPVAGDAPTYAARHRYEESPGRDDVRVVDLGSAVSDPTPDGALEILQAGEAGRVYAFDGSLNEWVDGDTDPQTEGVLAVAIDALGAAEFLGPPAVFDLDGVGAPEILLASSAAFFACHVDGSELFDGDLSAGSFGVAYADPDTGIAGPPMVATDGSVVLPRSTDGEFGFVRLSGFDGSAFQIQSSSMFEGSITTAGASLASLPGGGAAEAFVAAVTRGDGDGAAIVPLDSPQAMTFRATASPLTGVPLVQALKDSEPELLGRDEETRTLTGVPLGLGTNSAATLRNGPMFEGSLSSPAGGLQRPGGPPVLAVAAGRRLLVLDRNLSLLRNFPYKPFFEGAQQAGTDDQPAPLIVDLDGDGLVDVLWHDPSGGVHAVDLVGNLLSGFPLAGPAEPAGSSAVGDVDGDGMLEIVMTGSFPAIESVDAPLERVYTVSRGELVVLDLPVPAGAFAPWAQGRGGSSNRAEQPLDGSQSQGDSSGELFVDGTLQVRPHPVRGDELWVRIELRRSARVSATLYNLEGEIVAETDELPTGGGAFDQRLDVEHLVSGMYICRVHGDGETSTIAFAVVR